MGSLPSDLDRPRDTSILSPMPWFALFLVISSTRLQREPYCLPQAQAVLNGIGLDTADDSVLVRLGPPSRRNTRPGRDDGGAYQVRELIYPHLQVELGRNGRVERLLTTSQGASTPAGIRIGQTMEAVTQRLGISYWMDEFEEVTWTPPLCDDGPLDVVVGTAEVTFTWAPVPGPFDPKRPLEQERRLAKLEMTHYGP